MVWKASDGPCLWRDLLRGSRAIPLPPKNNVYEFSLAKMPFAEFPRLEKRCKGMIKNLEFTLFLIQKPKNNNA